MIITLLVVRSASNFLWSEGGRKNGALNISELKYLSRIDFDITFAAMSASDENDLQILEKAVISLGLQKSNIK
jgi:hypothetical protein